MADQKITALTADASPTDDDLLVTVNDPGGTPANRKLTMANLKAFLKTYFDTLYAVLSYATTVTAAGTTTLTSASAVLQYFTGSTTQTVVLPVVSTLFLGKRYEIVNNSTGVVTIQSSGANTIVALPANATAVLTCIAITGTGTSSWAIAYYLNTPGATWG